MQEEWKRLIYNDIDYGDRYLISNYGKVKNVKTGYIRKPSLDRENGYYYVCLSLGSRALKCYVKIHRSVAQTFITNPNNLPQVNHIDGNKKNNMVTNLEWVTAQENAIHAYKNGLNQTGENSTSSKLSKEDINYIRSHHIPNDSVYGSAALGRKYNVHPSTISKIVHNKNWKWD